MGAWLFRVVQNLVALELTHSITAVGPVTARQFRPTLLIYLGEKFADSRLGPWALLASPLLVGGGALGLLLALTSGTLTLPGLVVSGLCCGVATALDIPLRAVTIAEAVPVDLPRPALGSDRFPSRAGV